MNLLQKFVLVKQRNHLENEKSPQPSYVVWRVALGRGFDSYPRLILSKTNKARFLLSCPPIGQYRVPEWLMVRNFPPRAGIQTQHLRVESLGYTAPYLVLNCLFHLGIGLHFIPVYVVLNSLFHLYCSGFSPTLLNISRKLLWLIGSGSLWQSFLFITLRPSFYHFITQHLASLV